MRSLLVLCLVSACAADDLATAEHALGDPLLDQLQALPGVTVTELPPQGGARLFTLLVTQPVDHAHPDGLTFQQRVLLRSRGESLPTSLFSSGYGISSPVPRDSELSMLFQGNAVAVEHRYFLQSVPAVADPRYLTIKQAAADHHRIVQLLRPIYTGKWISTGASKGGMTSIYHRRFYPNDVDGTVAYVAPQSYTTNDPRYGSFLEQVGSASCRAQIIAYQRAFLDRRAELLPIFESFGDTYEQVGGLPIAYEHAVQEFRFAFWQYFDDYFCDEIPASPAGISADELASILDLVSGPSLLASDASLERFGEYYYQAATQLGSYGPLSLERHLKSRLQFPGTYRVERYSPLPVTKVDPFAMLDIQLWLATQGERVLLIYGENDPWTAGAFHLGNAQDSYRFDVPEGNHASFIGLLPEPAHAEVLDILARWAAAPIAQRVQARTVDAANDWQLEHVRRVPL